MNPPPKSIRKLAAEIGLSLSQIQRARTKGIDVKNPAALAKFKASIEPRAKRSSPPPASTTPQSSEGDLMTVDQLAMEISRRGLGPNEARSLKLQLEGLKTAQAIQREANELISRDEVREQFVALGTAIGGFCERAAREIPQVTLGLSIEKGLPLSRQKMRELQEMFCNRESAFWTKYKSKTEETKAGKTKRKAKP